MKRIGDVGEFELIRSFRSKTRAGASVLLGIGDDTAVLRAPKGKDILFTTDMLIEGKHFRLSEATAREIGRKALAVNVSDIAAMGGVPTHAVAAVGLPGRLPRRFADALYEGMNSLARQYGITIVGGDTNASGKLVVSVALLGEVEKGKAVRRSGARPGDVIFVSGELGGSYPSKKHLRFTPRLKEARFLAKNFKLGAMMDLSDGLAGDLRRIAEESGVGAVVLKEAVPVSGAAKDVRAALTDGEDFELLFTLPVREAARLVAAEISGGVGVFHPVGKIVEKKKGLVLLDLKGRRAPLAAGGFDHFKK